VPAKNLREFIALAKSKPGALNYASSGGGSPLHLSGRCLSRWRNVHMQHIPYKGRRAASPTSSRSSATLISNSGCLHFTREKRQAQGPCHHRRQAFAEHAPKCPPSPRPACPGSPRWRVSGNHCAGWHAGRRREQTVGRDRQDRDHARFHPKTATGSGTFYTTPEQFAALVKTDTARFIKIIKDANIKSTDNGLKQDEDIPQGTSCGAPPLVLPKLGVA